VFVDFLKFQKAEKEVQGVVFVFLFQEVSHAAELVEVFLDLLNIFWGALVLGFFQ